MRLLHTTKIELSESFDADIPPYAILSHRWGKTEVTFQDLERCKAEGPASYDKISHCCALASLHGYKWVWIDTCCIDKSSSAELSEAINSMYRWYEESKECYVYLDDVSKDDMDKFGSSEWFKRGWTLQELLAPGKLYFYDKRWRYVGSKQSLRKEIALATNIPEPTVENFVPYWVSVAARLSWASKRKTSRIEDIAYCLMGLFEINMPLLYGEGSKAFTRLQHEIVKNSDDESIFAWTDTVSIPRGLFAPSPAAFANSGDVVRHHFEAFHRPEPNTVTSRGLSMQLIGKVEPVGLRRENEEWIPLHCSRGKGGWPLMVKIRLLDSPNVCYREFPETLKELDEIRFRSREIRKIYIKDLQGRKTNPFFRNWNLSADTS